MSAAPVVARDGPKSAAHRDGPDLDSVPECAGAAYRLYGLDFSPYQDGQDPNVNPDVTPSQIRERLQRVAPCATWVRTFSVTHGLEASGAIAHSLGLQIAAGAWLGKNPQQNQQEIANLIALGQTGQADMLVVGSEALLRNDVTDAQLIAYINQVKQAVPGLPVATADVHDVLLLHPGVISASDVVLVNYYPYWVGVSVDQAMANVNSWHDLITAAAGGKPVIVSETGWPSQGNTIGSAVASLTNASYYFLNFVSWARAKSVNYFYFEAFDESWKAQYEGPQGAHWGILDKDGSLKAGFARVFNGETLPNNWDCSGVVGGAGTPSIGLTFVPPYGSSFALAGQIAHVSPDAFQVAVYLSVNGGVTWYVKPTLVQPITYAQCDGTWSTTVVTGGSDQLATDYAAFLVPRTYPPPALIGQPLPNDSFPECRSLGAGEPLDRQHQRYGVRRCGQSHQRRRHGARRCGSPERHLGSRQVLVLPIEHGWAIHDHAAGSRLHLHAAEPDVRHGCRCPDGVLCGHGQRGAVGVDDCDARRRSDPRLHPHLSDSPDERWSGSGNCCVADGHTSTRRIAGVREHRHGHLRRNVDGHLQRWCPGSERHGDGDADRQNDCRWHHRQYRDRGGVGARYESGRQRGHDRNGRDRSTAASARHVACGQRGVSGCGGHADHVDGPGRGGRRTLHVPILGPRRIGVEREAGMEQRQHVHVDAGAAGLVPDSGVGAQRRVVDRL